MTRDKKNANTAAEKRRSSGKRIQQALKVYDFCFASLAIAFPIPIPIAWKLRSHFAAAFFHPLHSLFFRSMGRFIFCVGSECVRFEFGASLSRFS